MSANNVTFKGTHPSASVLKVTSGSGALVTLDGASSAVLYYFDAENMGFQTTTSGGHIFTSTTGIANCHWRHCHFLTSVTSTSVWYYAPGSVKNWTDNSFTDCLFEIGASNTAAAFDLTGYADFNTNLWLRCRYNMNGAGAVAMAIDNAETSSYCYDNTFQDINVETADGGREGGHDEPSRDVDAPRGPEQAAVAHLANARGPGPARLGAPGRERVPIEHVEGHVGAIGLSRPRLPQAAARDEHVRPRKERFNLVHAHWGVPNALIAVAGRFLARSKARILTSFPGSDVTVISKLGWLGRLLSRIIARSDHLSCNSDDLNEDLVKAGLDASRIDLIIYGVDERRISYSAAERSRLRSEWGVKDDDIVLLMVGRFVPKKGFSTAFRALKHIAESGRRVKLVVVGEGPLRPEYEAILQSDRTGSLVAFVGELPVQKLGGHYSACDIFLMPSRRLPSDGLNVVVPEAPVPHRLPTFKRQQFTAKKIWIA